jgi:glycosyltransferase involved in cell wall biosynthesis
LKNHPDAVLMLFNAGGDYAKEINSLLATLPARSYRIIPFEPNISSAYHLMDVCVHTPIDEHSEAFGQVYIEALAASIPLVCTLSGIANDIIKHTQNAWVVPYKDSKSINAGIETVLYSQDLRTNLINHGKETIKDFTLDKMITNLENLYESV